MNATFEHHARPSYKLCYACLFCLFLQANANAQTRDSTNTNFKTWGVEVGYGPTLSLVILDKQSMVEATPLWRTQVGVSVSQLLGKRSFLTYKLSYRSFGVETTKFTAARRYINVDFIGVSLGYNRFLFGQKLIVGASLASDFRLRDYSAVVDQDGNVTKNASSSNTYRLFRWGAGLNCQMPIKLSKKLDARIGLEYLFSVSNLVSKNPLSLRPNGPFYKSYPTGLFLTTGIYF